MGPVASLLTKVRPSVSDRAIVQWRTFAIGWLVFSCTVLLVLVALLVTAPSTNRLNNEMRQLNELSQELRK